MEAAARDPGYRPDPPSSPRHPDPAGNQPVGKPAAQRTPGADAESPPPARRPGRDPGHIAPNNGIPVSPALPPPCNAMPPMRRPQMPKDTAQTTPRGLAAERPDEGASGDENHNVNIPQFKPPGDSLSAITESSDVARLLADMLEMDDVINVRAANDTSRPCTAYGPAAPTMCARRRRERPPGPHPGRRPGRRPRPHGRKMIATPKGAPTERRRRDQDKTHGPAPPTTHARRAPRRPQRGKPSPAAAAGATRRRLLRYAPPRRGAGRDDDSGDIEPETPAITAEGSRQRAPRRR